MKKHIQLNPLLLLAAMALLALGPALAHAGHPCPHAPKSQCVKAGPCAKAFPESGLRAGRLSSTHHWRNANKRNPEVPDHVQRVYRTKGSLSQKTPPRPFFAAAVHSPRNFRVLRI